MKTAPFAKPVLCLMLSLCGTLALAGPRDEAWAEVKKQFFSAQPQSALKALEEIETAARNEKAWAELAHAVGFRVMAQTTIQGGHPEEKIRLLEKELAAAPVEIRPVLLTFQALAYWEYFQVNRWRILERTRTSEKPGEDFETWDLPRLFAEIDARYQAALENTAALRAIPVADYDALLVKGNVPDRLRPTLYDFLAHEALNFYTADEQAGAAPQDAFEFDAASPALGTRAEFLAWKPESTDAASPKLRAIALYQELLRYHAGDPDAGALAVTDLTRIEWAAGAATGEKADERARERLTELMTAHADDEVSAAAAAALAERLLQENEYVEARKVAAAAAERHPESVFAADCRNLVTQVEQPDLTISTEKVWNAAGPEIEIRHRNLEAVHFRLVPLEWKLEGRRWDTPDRLDQDAIFASLKLPPAAEWKVALEKPADFRHRTMKVAAPADQKPGFYLLVASGAADFKGENNQLDATTLWVSPLALVTRTVRDTMEGFVLDAVSGEPIAGAAVDLWSTDKDGRWSRTERTKTDRLGTFTQKGTKDSRVLTVVRKGDAMMAAGSEAYLWSHEPRVDPLRTFFFTDRSLYRPGQTIRFKGVHAHADTAKNDYRALGGKKLTIRLTDVNGEEVETLDVTTNERGGFSGSFTAPKGRVTGQMTLSESNHGSAQISMEEYKRPKFQVTLDAPDEAPKLGEPVNLKGRAESYAGAAIDGAEVRWRVTREARWPDWIGWCGWFFPPTDQGAKEIAHGVARTGADGAFELRFPADPDRGVDEKSEPTFVYAISADVTDGAGETRTGTSQVTAGYTALKAAMRADEWQTVGKPVTMKVSTKTLDDVPLAAGGTVKVHRLQAPDRPHRPRLGALYHWHTTPDAGDREPDLSDPNHWPLGEVVQSNPFATDEKGEASIEVKLAAGEYRAVLETKDRFGRAVTALLPLRVLDPKAETFPIPVASHLSARSWQQEPGDTLEALWGTGYAPGRAFVEIEHRGQIVKRYWTDAGRTQQGIAMPVTEAERGGFALHVTQVRENRAHLTSRHIDVPWTNKDYTLRWERMRSKLEPGAKETWTLVVEGAQADSPVEMVAAMYDASLDAFLPHHWDNGFHVFYHDPMQRTTAFQNHWAAMGIRLSTWNFPWDGPTPIWRHFPTELGSRNNQLFRKSAVPMSGRNRQTLDRVQRSGAYDAFAATPATLAEAPVPAAAPAEGGAAGGAMLVQADTTAAGSPVDWSQVTARKNLEETAFFFPHMLAGEDGTVRVEFTMPEALTTWKFQGFAHDAGLRSGLLTGETVTSKDLMVQPNPPRFLREGDTVEFTVKVTNKGAAAAKGRVRLEFSDAATLASADAALGNQTPELSLDIPAGESRAYSWRIRVPDGQSFLQYRAVASAGTVSDGEEGWLPVLSRRILITESITLPIRDAGEKTFSLAKLLDSGQSDTLSHQSLTARMVSQPAWYAVQSLPYLMEYPHECSEQVFNRLYANALARHIATSNPRIRRIFDLWRDAQPAALDSPLLKNEDLKSVLIEETPWLRDAKDETAARRNVGILFDANRLEAETLGAMRKLEEMQIDTGAWPWFPGGRDNDFITLYLVSGFGRLKNLGVEVDNHLALRALDRLDAWISERHQACLRDKINRFGGIEALYLYARSFFLDQRPIAAEHTAAVDYFRGLARKDWPGLHGRMSQAHVALGLKRFGEQETPAAIVQSLRERSVTDDELGTYWRDTEQHWWWYRAPIETQAMMIEVFREVADDQKTADDCRVWLLKQRQTQAWSSTKSTADAIYALLLGGDDLLDSDALVTLSLGGETVKPDAVEAGTGYYEKRFAPAEITPAMGTVKLTKTDPGVSWGSLHWQYLEDIAKVTPHEDTPLTLKKSLFLKTDGKAGPELKPVAPGDKLKPGDEIVTRVELRTDRDLEFVHLKDQRGSGTEPLNVLSGYRFQDGLAYYESTRDAASHFFIEYLPKGVHVFETSARVQLRGQYQSGIAEIQCLYAPEFTSHSGSVALTVE
jgi:uncharacterized protein YfaS (alpha-2-macroglobulin family)